MNGEALVASLKAQGFNYLTEPECLQLLNDAYLVDICDQEDWPFLEKTKEGTTPLEITDLTGVRSVIDVTQKIKLKPLEERALTDTYDTDLTTAGSPAFYYLQEEIKLKVYPTSTTDTISVRYIKTAEALTGSSTPLLPSRFHSLIVDGAKARGYENSDDYELAKNAAETFQARLQTMRESLMLQYHDGPPEFVVAIDPGVEA